MLNESNFITDYVLFEAQNKRFDGSCYRRVGKDMEVVLHANTHLTLEEITDQEIPRGCDKCTDKFIKSTEHGYCNTPWGKIPTTTIRITLKDTY